MQMDITGRNVDVTPALKDFAADKFRKLAKLLDGPLEVHLVLGIEKHRHFAEVQVKSRTGLFSGTQETGDLYASISEVAEKLERQAHKHKEKMRHHKHRRGPRDPSVAAAIEATASAAVADPVPEKARSSRPRILRSENYRVKPLSAEDAVLELEASGEDLLVFRNAANDRVHVVYRKRDGDFALVEPEF